MPALRTAKRAVLVFTSALCLLLGFGPIAYAVPMLYTFEGTTAADDSYGAGFDHLPGGQGVSFVFLIDFDGTGTFSTDGVEQAMADTVDADYFYAEFVSGTNFYPRPATTPPSTYTANYGVNRPASESSISGSPTDYKSNSIYIFSLTPVNEWAVGDGLYCEDVILSNNTVEAYTFSNLTLTGIESVPEPSTILLFGAGLLSVLAAPVTMGRSSGRCKK